MQFQPLLKAIYAEWTFLPFLFEQAHFQMKGCLVSLYYYHVL